MGYICTANTWLTARMGEVQAIMPVLVSCAHCGARGGTVVVLDLPQIPRVIFQFLKLVIRDVMDARRGKPLEYLALLYCSD